MSTVRIGVIGIGMIGEEHIRRCSQVLSGAEIVALFDLNTDRANDVIAKYSLDAHVAESAESLIHDPAVDAVFVTSWGGTHAAYVLEAIAAGKYVFCEKPLATTVSDCERIVAAEVDGGRRLVQVGFMRPYDSGYRDLKARIDDGTIGEVLMVHAAHRNPSVGDTYTTDMAITDTLIHELDVLRWLLNDEFVSVQVLFPRGTSVAHAKLKDPQLVILHTKRGVIADIEVFVNCQYGYEIRCAVVGEKGEVALPEFPAPVVRHGGAISQTVLMDWKKRFIAAYDTEIQDFINGVSDGKLRGPDAWAGYLAAATADACLRAQISGEIEPVSIISRPDFYKH